MKKMLLALLFVCNSVIASECVNLYPDSKPIEVKNTVELCNSFYVSLFDKNHNRVILVSEHLKHGAVGSVKRTNDFHSDDRIGKHPNTSDYSNTGFDRGHLAPAADASNDKEMHETFLMTNMVPEIPNMNRVVWKNIEEETRKKLKNSQKSMYVVNIPFYDNDTNINGIPVPSYVCKFVIIEGENMGNISCVDNTVESKKFEEEISLNDFIENYIREIQTK